ncbi:rubrerythrin family protein [Microgenomates group bacterium]|nr:rubrerythrin family protein [Microgenomates group bacterium]
MANKNETYFNLARAYLGECQARNRYTFYSSVAKKEGFEQISAIFFETAAQEKEHAKNLFVLINTLRDAGDGPSDLKLDGVEIPNVYSTTADNLKDAIAGESHEASIMYPQFADIAEQEGYKDIAIRLRAIAKAEEHHSNVYQKLLELVEQGRVFKRDTNQVWACRECGYVHVGKEAPLLCPSCSHAQGYYEISRELY